MNTDKPFPLETQETLLWQGGPQRRLTAAQLPGLFVTAALIAGLLVWSFTGPVPEPLAELHEKVFQNLMARGVLAFTVLACLVIPHFYIRQINNSRYTITDRRLGVRVGGSLKLFDYGELSSPKVKPLGQGLADLRFWRRDTEGRELVIIHAIPAAVAEDAAKYIAHAD